jgi:hypothetical protein
MKGSLLGRNGKFIPKRQKDTEMSVKRSEEEKGVKNDMLV